MQRLELVVDKIRRGDARPRRREGFREEDCHPLRARPVDEMWTELPAHVAADVRPGTSGAGPPDHRGEKPRLRVWPAARHVHHAYRSGLLEHVLQD